MTHNTPGDMAKAVFGKAMVGTSGSDNTFERMKVYVRDFTSEHKEKARDMGYEIESTKNHDRGTTVELVAC